MMNEDVLVIISLINQLIMKDKFVYLVPRGGMYDCLSVIYDMLLFCQKSNRKCLLDFKHTEYKLEFNKIFYTHQNIRHILITENDKIQKILQQLSVDRTTTYYPPNMCEKLKEYYLGRHDIQFIYLNENSPNAEKLYTYDESKCEYYFNNKMIKDDISHDIIFFATCGCLDGCKLFLHHIDVNKNIIDHCINLYHQIEEKQYLTIQVRHTDYTCNYEQFITDYKETILSYNTIHIATDSKEVLRFLKEQFPSKTIINNTTYPEQDNYTNLFSTTQIDRMTVVKDLFADLFIAGLSEQIISKSKGRYINWMKYLHRHRYWYKFIDE